MKKLLIVIPIAFLVCIIFSCQQDERVLVVPKVDVEADIQAIKDIVADFNVALNTGDIDKASYNMADEFRVIPPNRPSLNGKDAFVRDLQQLFDQFILKEVDVVKDVQINGDLAVTHYTWTCETTPKVGGEPTNDNGNGIIVLRKQSGNTWKIIYSIWSNESLMPPEQSAVSSPETLGAADPIIGTWKLNVSKSKYPPNQPAPKEQTETYRELADGQIELTYQSIERDGSSSLLIENYPLTGGVPKVLKDDSPFSFIQTRIAQDEWLVTYLIDGK